MPRETPLIKDLRVSVYRVPTEAPESDGTLEWDSTVLVLVEATAGGCTGTGYTYSAVAAGRLIEDVLKESVMGTDAMDITATHGEMVRRVRNLGASGMVRMAISAVDTALWDLKARLLDLPLVKLLGQMREALPVYGSGGFTSYGKDKLRQQLAGWVEQGIPRVKMKVGRNPAQDVERVRAARGSIGSGPELMVDANGAFGRKQALAFMHEVAAGCGVTWMEQPLPPEDRDGARLLRDRSPFDMEIADGEYASDVVEFRHLIDAGVADVLMPDITRCGGVTGFMEAAAICDACGIPISTHCAPALHLHPACAVPGVRHAEYFHDHVRIERMFFDGFPEPEAGVLRPDLSAAGNGLIFRRQDATKFAL